MTALELKYFNPSGKQISLEQTKLLDEFTKVYYENGAVLKEEIFKKNELYKGVLYLNQLQDYTLMLDQIDTSKIWEFFYDKTTLNSHTLWKSKSFIKGLLVDSFGKTIFDQQGRMIASQGFNSEDEPISGIYKEFYFGGQPISLSGNVQGSFPDDSSICFSYRQDGSVMIIPDTGGWDRPYTSLTRFLDGEEDGPIIALMSPEQYAYYIDPNLLIPNF